MQKLRMERAAEDLMREVEGLLPLARIDAPNAADHLERACEAVMFNMAEGVGAYRPKVKIAAYEIAKKEASEVRAVLRRLLIKRSFSQNQVQRADNLAGAVVGMLTAAIKAIGDRD